MDIAELLKSEPLTADVIAKISGQSRASILRLIHELHLPAAYFQPIYTPSQARIIIGKINEAELERIANLQSKGMNHETPSRQFPNRQPRIANPTTDYRDALDARREARVRR